MSIIFRLDRMMADRKIALNELAKRIDLTDANLSILKTGKARAIPSSRRASAASSAKWRAVA